ncbi:hypothetical protein WMF28_42745 [Sorangium sp. So ce590]|uniref:hypothetical protein n=1 Tax=Sorangium sp. So ce590 TaxID=3133317 RepID=UPI003F5DAF99
MFVSASSGDDGSPGTKDAPVKTLQHAIGLAAHGRGDGKPPTRRVYACGGSFEETITLPSGVDLWGARSCAKGAWWDAWSYVGPDASTVIAPPAGIPVGALPVVTACGDGIESTGGYGGDGGLEAGSDGAPGQPEPAENPEGTGREREGWVGVRGTPKSLDAVRLPMMT